MTQALLLFDTRPNERQLSRTRNLSSMQGWVLSVSKGLFLMSAHFLQVQTPSSDIHASMFIPFFYL